MYVHLYVLMCCAHGSEKDRRGEGRKPKHGEVLFFFTTLHWATLGRGVVGRVEAGWE